MGIKRLSCSAAVILSLAIPGSSLPGADFVRGDVNQDGRLNITDAAVTLQFVFLGEFGSVGTCLDAVDVNDDGNLDASDGITVMTYLFLRGSAPPAPFPACGDDPTDDDFICESHAACDG